MGTTTDKINAILNTKENMKQKFNEKGIAVDDSVLFSQYPNKIDEISGGSDLFNANARSLKPTQVIVDASTIFGVFNTNAKGDE